MKTIQIPTHLSVHLDYELVGGGSRLGGFVIDWIIKWIYIAIIALAITERLDLPIYISIFLYIPFFLYSFLFEYFNKGQSLGKMITKSRVISTNGQPATVYQLLTRWFFNMVDVWAVILLTVVHQSFWSLMILSPLVGGMLIFFTKKNQRFGDLAADTIVVSTSESVVGIDSTVYKYAVAKADYEPKYPEIMRLSDRDLTKIQQLMEKGDFQHNQALIDKLAEHIKKILGIETDQSNIIFLNTILSDYNHYAKQDAG